MLQRFVGLGVIALVGMFAVPASARRLSGNTQIALPAETRLVMSVQELSPAVTVVVVCAEADGKATTVQVDRSSGFGELDRRILAEVSRWRLEPLVIAGSAVPHCEKVRFRHVLH